MQWCSRVHSCCVEIRITRHVTSCRVMSRYVALCTSCTSCHVMPRHVTSRHVISRNVTSCHVTSCHVMSRLAPSCHVMPRHVMSRHVTSRHVTSCYVISRRKSRDDHTTNASLSTDFFHTQSIQIRHDRVRWLSRRLPIPYRISGIWSSFDYFFGGQYKLGGLRGTRGPEGVNPPPPDKSSTDQLLPIWGPNGITSVYSWRKQAIYDLLQGVNRPIGLQTNFGYIVGIAAEVRHSTKSKIAAETV